MLHKDRHTEALELDFFCEPVINIFTMSAKRESLSDSPKASCHQMSLNTSKEAMSRIQHFMVFAAV